MRYILLFALAEARLLKCDLSLPATDLRFSPRLRGSTATFVEQGGKLHEQNYCVWLKKNIPVKASESHAYRHISWIVAPVRDLTVNTCPGESSSEFVCLSVLNVIFAPS